MPTLPWTRAEQPRSDASVVVLGSRLDLRAYRHIPGFVVAAMRVRRQVRSSPGAFGVSLIAQPARKTFWTLSAWADEDALERFVRTAPHTDVMARYHDRVTHTSFTTWSVEASDLPDPNSNAKKLWGEAKNRLAAPTEGASS